MEIPKTQFEDEHSPITSTKQATHNVIMSPKNPINILKTESWAIPNPVNHGMNNDTAQSLLNQSLTSQPKNFPANKSNNSVLIENPQNNPGVIRIVPNNTGNSVKSDNSEPNEDSKNQEKTGKIFNAYDEESIKRREALARRPSYRKILNDLSSASAEFIKSGSSVEGGDRSTPSPANSSNQNLVETTLISDEPGSTNQTDTPLSRVERQQQQLQPNVTFVSPPQMAMNSVIPDLKMLPSNLTLAQTYCLANLAAQTPLLTTTPGGPLMLGGLFQTPTPATAPAPPLIDFSSLIMNNFAAQQQQQQQQAVAAAAAQLQHQLLYQQIRAQQHQQQQQHVLLHQQQQQQQQQQQILAAAYQKMATMAALGPAPAAPPLAHQPRGGVKGGGKSAPPRKSSLIPDPLDPPSSGDGRVVVASPQNSSSDAKRRHVSFENASPDKGPPPLNNILSDTSTSSAYQDISPISNKANKSKATTMPGLSSKPTIGRSPGTLLNMDHQPSPNSPSDSNASSQEYKSNVPPSLPSTGGPQRLISIPTNVAALNNTNPNPTATTNDASLQFGSQLMSLVPGPGLNLTTGPGGQYISIPLNESYYHMRTTGQNIDDSANQQYIVQTGTGPPVVEEATRKREVRLLKNREAAKECRRKKKEYVKCLENRVAVLENQNKALIEELKSLKELYCQKQE